MPPYSDLKGITQFGHSELSEQLKANLIEFFKWGTLGIGAFSNVRLPGSGASGWGNYHRLRLVNEPNYTAGRVWEGARQDWVWESGINYGIQPIAISGVYINGTLHGTGYKINYPLGRVVFDSPIPTTSIVTMEYSYRFYHFMGSDVPWFREMQHRSFRADDAHFLQVASGDWNILSQNRVQLPAVVVEVVPRREFRGMQLGGGQWVNQDVLFHIYAEHPWDRDKLVDIISYQNDRTILSFNKNTMVYPLDFNGSIRNGAVVYPNLVSGYFWKKIFIHDMTTQEATSRPPLFRAIVRGSFELDFPEI